MLSEAKAALDYDVRLVSSGPLTDEQYFDIEGGFAEGTTGFCHYPDPEISQEPGIQYSLLGWGSTGHL